MVAKVCRLQRQRITKHLLTIKRNAVDCVSSATKDRRVFFSCGQVYRQTFMHEVTMSSSNVFFDILGVQIGHFLTKPTKSLKLIRKRCDMQLHRTGCSLEAVLDTLACDSPEILLRSENVRICILKEKRRRMNCSWKRIVQLGRSPPLQGSSDAAFAVFLW